MKDCPKLDANKSIFSSDFELCRPHCSVDGTIKTSCAQEHNAVIQGEMNVDYTCFFIVG